MAKRTKVICVDESLINVINEIQRRFYMSREPITKVEASWVLAKIYMGFDMNELVRVIDNNISSSPTRRKMRKKRSSIAMVV